MPDHKYRFLVETRFGQDQRQVFADSYGQTDDWLIFYRNPPQGGKDEYWRVRLDAVVCMETKRNV